MAFKRSEKSIRQNELTEKYLKNSVRNETTKIDIESLKASSDNKNVTLYDHFSQFESQDLAYELENGKLSFKEKRVIKKILNERKKA